jgi:hypothetical protein
MAIPGSKVIGATAQVASTTLGKKALDVGRNFASGVKGAAMSQIPAGAFAAYGLGRNFASQVRERMAGSGSTTATEKFSGAEARNTRVITNALLENTRVLKDINQSVKQSAGIQAAGVAQDKEYEKQRRKEHKELLEKVEESGTGGGDDKGGKKPGLGARILNFGKNLLKNPYVLGGLAVVGGVAGAKIIDKAFGTSMAPSRQRPSRSSLAGGRSSRNALYGNEGNLSLGEFDYDAYYGGDSVGGAGSRIAERIKPIPTENKKLEKLQEENNKLTKKITESTGTSGRWAKTQQEQARKRRSRAVDIRTEEQKILDRANEKFLKDFQRTTTQVFKEELSEIFPDPRGVRARGQGQLYRGTTLGDILNIDDASARIFGKRFGPLFSTLADSYLEVGARKVGESLFGNILGSAEESRALTGQILGNYKAGKKTLAAEQLVYGLTGIPLGTETLANKFGFSSTSQGVEGIANVLGAATQSALFGGQSSYIDPRTGKTVQYSGMGDAFGQLMTNVGGFGGIFGPKGNPNAPQIVNMPAKVVSTQYGAAQMVWIAGSATDNITSSISGNFAQTLKSGDAYGSLSTPGFSGGVTPDDVAESTVNTSETIHQLYENTDEWGSRHEDVMIDTSKTDIQTQQQVGTGIMGTFQSVGQFLMGGLNSVVNAIMSRPAGGGTQIGFGGSFGGGDFMSMMGQAVGSTLIAVGVNKLTKGIKDPNLRMVANLAGNYAGQKYIMGNFGGVAGTGQSIFSAGQGASTASGLYGGFTGLFSNMAMPGAGGALGFGNFLASQGGFLGSVGTGMNLVGANMTAAQAGLQSSFGTMAGQAIGYGLPYVDAISRAFKGDIGGAFGSAAATYAVGAAAAGTMSAGAVAAALTNPATAALAAIAAIFGGSLFGKKPMKPVLERAIAIAGNNNPKAIMTIQERHKSMKDLYPALDSLLLIAFNTAKLMETKLGSTPWGAIGIFFRAGEDVVLKLYRKDKDMQVMQRQQGENREMYRELKYAKNLGKAEAAFKNPGSLASDIVKFITDSTITEYENQNENKEHETIRDAAATIQGKTFNQLTEGVIKELDDLDPNQQLNALGLDPGQFERLQQYRSENARREIMTTEQDTGNIIRSGFYEYLDPSTGKYRELTAEEIANNVVGFDTSGNPIIDVNPIKTKFGTITSGLDMADIIAHEEKFPEAKNIIPYIPPDERPVEPTRAELAGGMRTTNQIVQDASTTNVSYNTNDPSFTMEDSLRAMASVQSR